MTGNNGHDVVSELIGAWAVDACSAAEADLVQAHLPGCVICAGEASALRATATELLRPAPAGLATRLRSAMPARRRPAPHAPRYAKPYAAQVAALDLMLTGLTTGDWQQIAAYEQMSVHDLLAHLIAVDGMVADALGLTVSPPVEPAADAAARTAAVLAVEQARPASETLQSWRDQADAVCRALPRSPEAATVTLGWPMPVSDALLARAFETWIHSEDIAGATLSPVTTPLPEHLHPMADLAVRMLPKVTSHFMPSSAGRHIRLNLTGGGGGSWTVPLGGDGEAAAPDAEITVDVVEFCRLVGNRCEPEALPVELGGDLGLAREWIAVAPQLAPYP